MLSIAIRIDGHFVFPVVVDAWRGGVHARGAATLALRSAGIGLSTGGTGPAAGRIRTIRVRALRLRLLLGLLLGLLCGGRLGRGLLFGLRLRDGLGIGLLLRRLRIVDHLHGLRNGVRVAFFDGVQ